METLKFDLSKKAAGFKILNATNGGPCGSGEVKAQFRSNFAEYKAARIPYTRNHDSGIITPYGGPYSHDISKIFRNFDADVNDPLSYDFACTDADILNALNAGTKTFFRLGETIEHQVKKHATVPPKDFQKWAEICEHVIMHYTEGWADGFRLDIQYWELWNEPDAATEDPENPCGTWSGTHAQFFDFYETAAKHLKKRFPHLKIGGPALAHKMDWAERFLKEMAKREVPIDFFSWHIYCVEPQKMVERANKVRQLLDENGYKNAESILNEWNYVKGWREEFVYTLLQIHGIKGGAFVMSMISEAQKCDGVDMLMYYDSRGGSGFNGVFDFYTLKPLKAYYALAFYGNFYDMEYEVRCENEPENIYTLCGVDKSGKALCIITNYADDDDATEKTVKLDFGREGRYEVYTVDAENDGTLTEVTENTEFTLKPLSFIMVKEV